MNGDASAKGEIVAKIVKGTLKFFKIFSRTRRAVSIKLLS
jgi:hypothetical protein